MSRPKANPVGHNETPVTVAPSENLTQRPPVPPAPAHLGAYGAKVWADVWAAGGDVYHPPTDFYVIERYASLQERARELRATLGSQGYTSMGSQGQEVAHPAARLLDAVEAKLTTLEDRLGLNPESRLRLGITAVEHKSKLDAFLEGN